MAATSIENLLFCPYTENVDESWISELVFSPGESRIRLLQWLFCKLDSRLNDVLDPQQAPPDSRMDSRIQRLLFVASSLGLCQNDDVDIVRGVKSGSRQIAFINNLLDLVSVVDNAESSLSVLGSHSGHGSLEDQFVADCRLMNTISSQTTIDSLFPTDIRLLPPDIARQIELDRQEAAKFIETDKSSTAPDVDKLIEEVNRLAKDLERQNSMLAEVTKKHKSSSTADHSTSICKSTLRQTLQLSLSELDQLITSFGCCYDNEMRPWCGSLSVSSGPSVAVSSSGALGPALKRVNGPLEQFDNLLTGVRSIRSSYRKLCSELHRDIGKLRVDIERLANAQPSQDGHMPLLCSTLSDAVDVLEQSVMRVESGRESVNASAVSSSIAGTLNASVVSASIRL